jgi:hypothetical protein
MVSIKSILSNVLIYDWSLDTHVDFRINQILIGCKLMDKYINNLE